MRDYVHKHRNYFYDPIIEPPGPDKVDPMGKNVLQLVNIFYKITFINFPIF